MNKWRSWCKLAISLLLVHSAAAAAESNTLSPHVNYLLRCSGCHGADGTGSKMGGIPAFPGLISSFASDDTGRTYVMHVPGVVSTGLDNREIAEVMNYIVARWGDPAVAVPSFTAAEVDARRAIPVADIVVLRRDIARQLTAQGLPVAEYPWP
ncbi:hypothetical protein AGMMS49543_04070 [Betaproteobacteria bacterium]|nr:hypothetical protein AGMMS49543_04070 [Betaproteobacteria bacterium]GHU21355.1 hypothetical protein AGMMS50243_18850 [Betaproteobacteria bacterium]